MAAAIKGMLLLLVLALCSLTAFAQAGSDNHRLTAGSSVATGGKSMSSSGVAVTSSTSATTCGQWSSTVYRLVGGATAVCYATAMPTPCCTVSGDVDQSGEVNISDLHYIGDFLHKDGPEPPCFEAADVNGDGLLTQSDMSCIARKLFSRGNPCEFVGCP